MRPFRNIWMLEEIGPVPYTHLPCKPWSKVAKSVHPLGKVPALLVECNGDCPAVEKKDGEERSEDETVSFVVIESAAINTFLGDLAREISTAVKEARRQFDNALDAMIGEMTRGVSNGDGERYLLPTGFSAVDILFANCCIWAQQIGWLEKTPSAATTRVEKQTPKNLPPSLEAYLKRCRSRPAFVRAKELRNSQMYAKNDGPIRSKL